jgi:membrane protein required for beta-lactamase induction
MRNSVQIATNRLIAWRRALIRANQWLAYESAFPDRNVKRASNYLSGLVVGALTRCGTGHLLRKTSSARSS